MRCTRCQDVRSLKVYGKPAYQARLIVRNRPDVLFPKRAPIVMVRPLPQLVAGFGPLNSMWLVFCASTSLFIILITLHGHCSIWFWSVRTLFDLRRDVTRLVRG